jgi:L-malate glycosyltransferase
MNILIVTNWKSSYNSVRPEAEMCLEFARKGHGVTVMTQADSEYGGRCLAEGLRVIDFDVQRKLSFASIRSIHRELHRQHYDVLYATNSKAIPNCAFAAVGCDVKLVTYRGTTGGLYRHDPSSYLTHLHPRVDGIVCVSEAVREDVSRRVWKNRDRVVAIHKGHDVAWYDIAPADLGEFGIKPGDFTVICAVNARPSKGIPVMLAATDLLADLPNLHLLLIGKNMDGYRPIIARSKMAERIHVTGYRYDAPALIAASDVLVQPSISGEGLPRAVMEAMGYGTPCVITDTGGGKEVIEDGVCGFVVPTHNPAAIARRVRDLYNSPQLLTEFSRKGRERISSEFSCDRSTDRFLAYFSTLIGN